MVSKGVDIYVFADTGDIAVGYSVPGQSKGVTGPVAFFHDNVQVDSSQIPGMFNYTGPYAWQAFVDGNAVVNRGEQINSLDGNMEGGDFDNYLRTPSVVGPDNAYAVSYGFYDASTGWLGLTNQDQSYVYATSGRAQWMGDLAAADAAVGTAPFRTFVLPGAHDAGMYDTTMVDTLLNEDSAALLGLLIGWLGPLAVTEGRRALVNLSFTQKDDVTTMLDLGVRYFDFRPGYLKAPMNSFDGGIYHQHNFVPGVAYQTFLSGVTTWLAEHPTEVVVVALGTAGFDDAAQMTPTVDDLAACLAAAIALAPGLSAGDQSDLATPYADLVSGGRRLLVFDGIHGTVDKYDSYSDSAYQTTDPATVLAAVAAMNATDQASHQYTVLQLQGTENGTEAGALSQATFSDASSPLIGTKAAFDSVLLPWTLANVLPNLGTDHLVVLLDDFADNALATCARDITAQRVQATQATITLPRQVDLATAAEAAVPATGA